MSTAIAIRFEHVSKTYRGGRRYGALREDFARLSNHLFSRAGAGFGRALVKALDDVSFEIPEGQSFGLIGANGAGKTTALKLASRITYPSGGCIHVRGRVGALIEVGTGMHPELTGRENIQLYGRILGLSGRDIARRFDEIVEFSGIGDSIDQPVKQFSSGMQLRLGFSVAAHLEPDILLVDEAIAVGDAGFQYRCVERMSQLVREGRTLIFVSHDMSAIETLCERAALLRSGRVVMDGPAREVVRQYLLDAQADYISRPRLGELIDGQDLVITAVTLHTPKGDDVVQVTTGDPLTIRLHYEARRPIVAPSFSIGLSDGRIGCFSLASMLIDGHTPGVLEGEGWVDCAFTELPLQPRVYEIWGSVRGQSGFGDIVDWQRLRLFRVVGDVVGSGKSLVTHSLDDAPVRIPYQWRFSFSREYCGTLAVGH